MDGYNATELKEFLLRPFEFADRSIPLDRRMLGDKTKGYIFVNVALGRYGFFFQGYARYDFDNRKSLPTIVPEAERLNRLPASKDEMWAFVERTYPDEAAAALLAVEENRRFLRDQRAVSQLPPQEPPGK